MSGQPPSNTNGERPWVPPSGPGVPPPGQPTPPQGPPPSGYVPHPAYAAPPVQPVADPGPAPQQVRIAAILAFVVAGLGVLTAATLPLQRGYFLATMQRSLAPQPQPAPFDVGVLVDSMIYMSMAFVIGGCVLWVVLGVKVRQGRNWARIVVTVFAALTLVSVPIGLLQLLVSPVHAPLYSYAGNVVGALIDIAVLLLLWRQPGARWITARTAYRRQQRHLRP